MGERRGIRGLELWCRRMTQGYPGVEVINMTTSWRDGLAFCAIIHHFRPDLIDFSKLNKDDIYQNNDLAFQIAERHLGIPALLEPADMVESQVPDRLCILTYLSQFYQAFGNSEGSPQRISPKRPTSTVDRGGSPVSKTPSPKISRQSTTDKDPREPCTKCGLPVYIAQHLNIGKQIYHRTCFRCARCDSQLTLANYYETEVPNQFCCETCPDEEKLKMEEHAKVVLNRSLSDDEKKAGLHQADDCDDYSSVFENVLENSNGDSLLTCDTLCNDFVTARSRFFLSQIENTETSSSEEEAGEQADFSVKENENGSLSEDRLYDSGLPSNSEQLDVNSCIIVSDVSDSNQPETATDKLDINKIVTKDNTFPSQNQSLVKSLMLSFENKIETEPDISDKITKNDVKEVESHSINNLELDSIKSEIQEECKNKNESIITISSAETSVILISDDTDTSNTEKYPEDLNPFGDDEPQTVETTKTNPTPVPAVRKKIKVRESDLQITGKNDGTPEALAKIEYTRLSLNPFYDEHDTEVNDQCLAPKKVIAAPKISLNPFWSDGEDPDEEDDTSKLSTTRNLTATPEAKPRKLSAFTKNTSLLGSNASLSSAQSSFGTTGRKKKQAPKPPTMGKQESSAQSSITSSPSPSLPQSPKMTPKLKKSRKAPEPPTFASTPFQPHEKSIKDEVNRNRQSWIFADKSPSPEAKANHSILNKSVHGKWKRRKGPAPLLPVPQKRNIKPLPVQEIKRELEILEIQLQGLEKQGVALEKIIRERSEGPDVDLNLPLSDDVDDLILQLFELVNEKNELFRKQAEFMYLRRQQKLEEEHADLEYQIRLLMSQPESSKTDSHKTKEEELINRLVEIVERRNEIVHCLDMDRVRETEEDLSINNQLNLYTLKREESSSKSPSKEVKKKSKKNKKFTLKITKKTDADKDIDESEVSKSSNKFKKKKRFNIF